MSALVQVNVQWRVQVSGLQCLQRRVLQCCRPGQWPGPAPAPEMLWVWGMEDPTTPALWQLKTLLLGVWRLSSLVIRSTVLLANMQTMFDEAWTLFNPTRDRVWSVPWWDGIKEYFWPKKGKASIKIVVTFHTFSQFVWALYHPPRQCVRDPKNVFWQILNVKYCSQVCLLSTIHWDYGSLV